ncbi:MAG TPA: hypothetical protein VF988_05225, partial [Verrucomicrobiae bacterium]
CYQVLQSAQQIKNLRYGAVRERAAKSRYRTRGAAGGRSPERSAVSPPGPGVIIFDDVTGGE